MIELLKPPPDPINYEAHDVEMYGKILHVPEVSCTARADWAIRTMMEQAVQYDDESVLTITKELLDEKLAPLHEVMLERPFRLSRLNDVGSNNNEMKVFAFDAYDALAEHFGSRLWDGWFIAPFFAPGDDMNNTFYLGVFAADYFGGTVIE